MRRAALPAVLAALVAVLVFTLQRHPDPVAADRAFQGDPPPSDCRVIVEVTLDPKLVCPLRPVAVRFRIQATCPAEQSALRIDALRLVSPFPEGIIAYEPNPGGPALPDSGTMPEPWRFELSDEVAPITNATLWVRPLHPGTYEVGAADVEIVDSEGRVATAKSTPARLLVAEGCEGARPRRVYLPALVSPTCAPSTMPTDFALVLDRSTSIGADGLAAELAAVEGFIDQLVPGRDRVTLVAFDEQAEIVTPLGPSFNQVRAALGALGQRQPLAGTRLDRAISSGITALGAEQYADGRRRILVLISDGVHFGPGGQEPVLRAADRARALGVRIATMVVGSVTDRRFMARITTAPELSYNAADGSTLASAFRNLADETGTVCTN